MMAILDAEMPEQVIWPARVHPGSLISGRPRNPNARAFVPTGTVLLT
jgi:hypothetical protein